VGADYLSVSRHLEQALGVPPLIRVNGKRALDAEWTTGPRLDPSGWRRRLADHGGNVGLLTGDGLVVVDVDLYHDGADDAIEALFDLGLPRETTTGITGGGGRHLLYRTDAAIPSRTLEGYAGIDIKADGGMVVVPPSVHPVTGRAYEWEFGWAPGEVEPATLPAVIVELFSAGGHRSSGELDERDEQAVRLLADHFGGHSPRRKDGYVELTRPGKAACMGGSATVGVLGRGVTKVWSSKWKGLPDGVYPLSSLRRLAGVEGPRVHIPTIEPPAGYRWWQPGDDDRFPPTLDAKALHGAVGDYVRLLEGRTEAHPAAIGFSVLAYLGTWLGRGVAYTAGPDVRHPPALWGGFVGPTSSGAKGISWSAARLLLDALDRQVVTGHTASGFGSGEALVYLLRDDDEHPHRAFVVHDHELAGILRVAHREGSTLSELMRKAFDGEQLENRTRAHGELVASRYHLAALGSITAAELLALLDDTSIFNGLGNRFLWLWSELTHTLPFGAEIDLVGVGAIADRIGDGLVKALATDYRIAEHSPAGERWRAFYAERRRGVGDGAVQALTARHHVHAARIATVYAAVDGAATIGLDHVDAGIAWCDYSLGTVELVFGEGVTGDARRLLDAVRAAGRDGLDGTAQRDLFQRHLGGDALDALRAELGRRGLIHTVDVPTAGRPRRISIAISPKGSQDAT
jgi:hypothetical protein